MSVRFRILAYFALTALLGGTVFALPSCSADAARNACNGCSFTNNKIDSDCMEGFKNDGIKCVLKAYPALAANQVGGYIGDFLGTDAGGLLDGCPSADACTKALEMCIGAKCPGNDRQDCDSAECQSCYTSADRCIARAAADCKGEAKCGDKSCDDGKGETQETCCKDCGCPEGQQCKDDKCLEKKADEEVTTSTLREDDSEGDDGFIDGLLYQFCGIPSGLLLLPLSMLAAGAAKMLGLP